MVVDAVHLLCEDRYNLDDIRLIMADYTGAMKDDNDTMAALRSFFTGEVRQQAIATLPFTSAKKFGGVSFHADETYGLGAPDVLLGARYGAFSSVVDAYAAKGCRVLLLADYSGSLTDETLSAELLPLALIPAEQQDPPGGARDLPLLHRAGRDGKVISGDNPLTVSEWRSAPASPARRGMWTRAR